MFYISLTLVVLAVIYSNIHSLQIKNMDRGKFFKYLDQPIKNIEYQAQNNDDYLRLIQNTAQRLNKNKRILNVYKNQYLNNNKKQQKYNYNKDNNFQLKKYLFGDHPWLKSLTKQKGIKDRLSNQGFLELDKAVPNNLSDYSKLYVVLNPEANLSKSDVRDMSNMISSLFSKSDFKKQNGQYSRFKIKDNRRRIRELKEIASKDSIEHDYKPKRARGDYGGGGGRTAIPYIRQRGNIYETE